MVLLTGRCRSPGNRRRRSSATEDSFQGIGTSGLPSSQVQSVTHVSGLLVSGLPGDDHLALVIHAVRLAMPPASRCALLLGAVCASRCVVPLLKFVVGRPMRYPRTAQVTNHDNVRICRTGAQTSWVGFLFRIGLLFGPH